MPVPAGVNVSNVGFHAPPQHPGSTSDGTVGNAGYSSTPWTQTLGGGALAWNTETFALNENANAIRWGTLYNFRFDSDRPPQSTTATIGFFKTGSPITVAIQGPVLRLGVRTSTGATVVEPSQLPAHRHSCSRWRSRRRPARADYRLTTQPLLTPVAPIRLVVVSPAVAQLIT